MKIRAAAKGVIAVFAMVSSIAANAVDFYWTGGGNDGKWSTAANWATDDQGTPATAAPKRADKANYYFDVPAGGLTVTEDDTAGIIVKQLVVTTESTDPVELKIVSASSGCEFEFTDGASMTVGTNATLVLNTDMGGSWTAANLPKYGAGTVVFDLVYRTPMTSRPLVVKEGTAVVASTSLNPRFAVTMDGSDPANPPVFENQLENGLYGHLIQSGAGDIQLNGKRLNVGDYSVNNSATNTIPTSLDAGTLSYANERVANIVEPSPKYDIELDRADLIFPGPSAQICWFFDDVSNPQKDMFGQGERMVASGTHSIVDDATRGNVLSFTGANSFKGPDANTWLDGFEPKNGFTIAFWLKPDSSAHAKAKILYWGENTNGKCGAIRLHDDPATNLFFSVWNSNYYIPCDNVRNGEWHHLAVVFNGKHNTSGNFLFYYDGALAIRGNYWSTYNPSKKDFYIGNVAGSAWGTSGSENPYKGLMDDFLIAGRAMSAAEIAKLKNDGLSSLAANPSFKSVTAKSAGVLSVEAPTASVKTLSGTALAGGVQLVKDGSSLTVGTDAGSTATVFQGTISGSDSTLVKAGADYELTLEGAVKGVANVVVDAGTLTLKKPLRKGLVTWYSFDDDSDFGRDDGPGEFNLANVDTGTPTVVNDGVRGKAIHFGGTSSPVVLSSGSQGLPSAFPSRNDSLTVSFWVRPTTAACTGSTAVFAWGKSDQGRMSLFRFDATVKNFVWHFSGDAYMLQATSAAALDDGNWHHIVGTYDGATHVKKLYCDGALVGTKEIASTSVVNIDPTYYLELGRYVQSTAQMNRRYEGDMDEFMVFDYVWSADEVAAEYNNTATPSVVPPSSTIPTPVARWTFDGEDPLADTTGNPALKLTEASTNSSFNVTYVSGDAICGKAAKFSTSGGNGYLKLDTFPTDIIPAGSSTFTVIVRYRPYTSQIVDGALSVVGWGTAGGYTSGQLFRIGPNQQQNESARFIIKNSGVAADGSYRTWLGNDRTRWYTVAVVHSSGTYKLYVDGVLAKSGATTYDITADMFAIGASYTGNKAFTGYVDDIQIYDCALTGGQVHTIAEQFEESKGKATTDASVPAGVLRDAPDVTVADGATLRVASNENVGNLSGAGSVEIAPLARLNVLSSEGFTGTVTGDGLVGFADGATLDIGDGSELPLLDVNRPVAIGTNVTVNTTARSGRHLIARASSFVGAENLDSWTLTINGRRYRFFVSGGTDLCLKINSGMSLFLR